MYFMTHYHTLSSTETGHNSTV